MSSVTIDTCVWLKYLDRGDGFENISKLFDYCKSNSIKMYSSSRVFSFDTVKMNSEQVSELKNIFKGFDVTVDQANFRLGASKLGSVHNQKPGEGLGSVFDTENEIKFKSVFGVDPVERNPQEYGKKLSNWIGDYDSLKHHYLNNRDLYVTTDEKLYMSKLKRVEAKEKLGLNIVSPTEALSFFVSF